LGKGFTKTRLFFKNWWGHYLGIFRDIISRFGDLGAKRLPPLKGVFPREAPNSLLTPKGEYKDHFWARELLYQTTVGGTIFNFPKSPPF